MTVKSKKKIIVSPELKDSAMGAFFEEQGFELSFQFSEGSEYAFAVNDACPEVTNLPRLQTKDSLDSKFHPYVRSCFNEEYLQSELGKKLLTSYFKDGLEFDLVDRYSKDFKNIYTIKIHEYLNMGFFIDSIIVEAYKAGFDITILRDYLHTALNYSFKKVEQDIELMPIDVSYSHNGEAFAVQISMNINDFKGAVDFEDSAQMLRKNCNFFDVTYFHKKTRLTLSSLIFKDQKLRGLKACFFTEIAKKSHESEVGEVEADLQSGLVVPEKVNYVAEKKPDEQSKKLSLARKFALFIKNYRQNEESPKSVDRLELIDVDYYLSFYPKQAALAEVDDEIKKFIFKLLKDDQLFNGISDYIQKVASSNLDDHTQEIQRILGEKSLDDIEEIMMISGSPDDKEQMTRVKGWTEDANDEKWEVKRSQINEKIQDEVTRISSEGRNVVQDDIIRVVAKELNAQEKDVKVVVGGIVEEVVSSELVKNQKLEEAFALKILAQQSPDQVREKLESQITRMKKIMDQMKRELIKHQTEKVARESEKVLEVGATDDAQVQQVKTALAKTMELLKAKEKMLEKAKGDFELISKGKDQKIEKLTERIEELKGEFANSRVFANEERLQQLEAENKVLNSRLELANKKVNIISENIENRENESLGKREKEIEALRANMQMAQSVIERFKQDKLEMEARYNEEREISRKLKEERAGNSSSGSDKDTVISALNAERKMLEDKYRAQGIELKKAEQQLKYTTSKLEALSKKKGSGTTASGQKSPEHYAKQLDQASARLAEATAEVTEKRKELVKLKQENSLMSSKLVELEKKLGLLDKKAA